MPVCVCDLLCHHRDEGPIAMRRDQSTAQVAGHFRPGHFVGLRRLLDDGFDRGVNGLLRKQIEGRAFRVELGDRGRRRRVFPVCA